MNDRSEPLQAARAMRQLLREHAPSIERMRRLSDEVIANLKASHAFNLQLATEYGGCAADPLDYLKVIEELSRGDASAGWCAMVGSESSACINAYLPEAAVREMIGETAQATAALTVVGNGTARRVDSGFMVSGRWRFASGCRHADWLGGLCTVSGDDGPETRPTGAPLKLLMFAPAAQVELIDTWHTSGLCGTASDDFVLREVFVPTAHAADLFAPPLHASMNWRVPASLRFAMSKAAACTGIALAALDHLEPWLDRVPFAGAQPVRAESRVHVRYAEALSFIEGGRDHLFGAVARMWDVVMSRDTLDQSTIARTRLAIVDAARRAGDTLQAIQDIGGTACVLDPALDRALRDLNVARHHLQLQPHIVEDAGRVLLGLAPRNPLF